MKYYLNLFLTVFFATTSALMAQDYERVDASILLYPETFKAPEQLAKFITRDFISEEEKVRAMYSWIIQNIAYDPDEYKKFNFNFKNYRERNEKEEKTREKIIERTLQKGIAVCEGYAMLFEKLCELQGIENYLVRGDIKTNFNDIGRPFKKSHMWNVVVLEGKPYLFDVTWGAGKYRNKFLKEPSYFFYKTEPELFFKTHYPDMQEDAFLDRLVSKEVFANMPLIIKEEMKMGDIESPMMGIISRDEYFDQILFTVNSETIENVSYSYGSDTLEVRDFERKGDQLRFSIPLQPGADNLLIYFDSKPALGYKVQ
ncbi:transglutaminase domain-containing protein [Ulvibacter antarcticus]|uniref:Transglutaminase superfamily protein n=1 Tax=Ulvibacter antarcticus TaxID=442714 RepID=A0A3L9Z7I9_9FLAO|nr:transglutaminase domain-containing protein [Ulvibacter antarcticus]RMA66408.1 transglutaminase superfamily protein [Ulvibacter antarcticus]